MGNKRNVSGIKEHAYKKSTDTKQKVEQALKILIKEKNKINFNIVAEKSGVSKPYLYNNEDFRNRIITLREQQSKVINNRNIKRNMSNESKDAIIEVLREKIKKLENKNYVLNEEIKQLRGALYEHL